jgi:uncharacterized protein YcfL
MHWSANSVVEEPKRMKKLVFALAGVDALALAGCSYNNPDQVNNVEMNQPAVDLNAQASDSANDAANAEADALGNQEKQLENKSADNTVNPDDAQEQNVSGM